MEGCGQCKSSPSRLLFAIRRVGKAGAENHGAAVAWASVVGLLVTDQGSECLTPAAGRRASLLGQAHDLALAALQCPRGGKTECPGGHLSGLIAAPSITGSVTIRCPVTWRFVGCPRCRAHTSGFCGLILARLLVGSGSVDPVWTLTVRGSRPGPWAVAYVCLMHLIVDGSAITSSQHRMVPAGDYHGTTG